MVAFSSKRLVMQHNVAIMFANIRGSFLVWMCIGLGIYITVWSFTAVSPGVSSLVRIDSYDLKRTLTVCQAWNYLTDPLCLLWHFLKEIEPLHNTFVTTQSESAYVSVWCRCMCTGEGGIFNSLLWLSFL